MPDQLERWWRSRLSPEQRDRLIAVGDGALPAQLAYDVWRSSGAVLAVDHVADADGAWTWRLTPEVAGFVRERGADERTSAGHPGPRVA